MPNSINLLHVRPPGNPAADCFIEIMELFALALRDVGVETTVSMNRRLTGVNLVFGAHLLTGAEDCVLTDDDIIFQTEQLPMFMSALYLKNLQKCKVWDYSERNCDWLAENGCRRVSYVPFGYHPAIERVEHIDPEMRDFDFLFYGAQNQRRRFVISTWWAHDFRVKYLDSGVYAAERDEWIANSKVVTTIHQFQDKVAPIHEMARVYYLMTNKACVLSEVNDDTHIYPWVREAIVTAPYENLVKTGFRLATDFEWQKDVAARSYEAIKARPLVATLLRVVDGVQDRKQA